MSGGDSVPVMDILTDESVSSVTLEPCPSNARVDNEDCGAAELRNDDAEFAIDLQFNESRSRTITLQPDEQRVIQLDPGTYIVTETSDNEAGTTVNDEAEATAAIEEYDEGESRPPRNHRKNQVMVTMAIRVMRATNQGIAMVMDS
ncbi:hypothetical protein ACFFQF_30025 [Haladaptatus pallidirubidus]|uniref:Uncharacterized protein n=1 Tax=Haladaptatus pallidirubidus TaxID=1008152 RepID=A0AAV3UI86_9EURY|nr:hypothetical protein [Haladaptatus pallidirubidus]